MGSDGLCSVGTLYLFLNPVRSEVTSVKKIPLAAVCNSNSCEGQLSSFV